VNIPLQPLRIPSGWTVEFNDGLYEIDPSAEAIPIEKHIWFFKEDMLLLTQNHYNRSLSVGWFPEGNLKIGEYDLVVFESSNYDQPIHHFRTRDRQVLVSEINRLLIEVSNGKL